MPHNSLPLKGFAILLVEDEPLIALDICMTLEDAGATVIGPCSSVAHALLLLEQGADPSEVRGAVLDVDLGNETSVPVALKLAEKGIPFVFHSGMDPAKAETLTVFDAPIVNKPSTGATLISAIAAVVDR